MKRPIFITVGCILSGSLGFLIASRHPLSINSIASASHRTETQQTVSENHSSGTAVSHSTSTTKTPTEIDQIASDLRQRITSFGAFHQDWILRSEVKTILSKLSIKDLHALALHLQEGPLRGDGWQFFVLTEISREWSKRNPAEACIGLSEMAWYRSNEAYDTWAAIDPEAAHLWLEKSLKSGDSPKLDLLQSLHLNRLAIEDLPAAVQQLQKASLENRQKALRELSSLVALDTEQRKQLLIHIAALGDDELLKKCRANIVSEMAEKSPWEASQFVEGSDFSDEEKHALSETVLGKWAIQDPQEAFRHWADLKEQEAPQALLDAMQNWSINSPGAEQAFEWVNQLQPGAAREKFKENLIGIFYSFGRPHQAGELIQSLEAGDTRTRWLNRLARAWSEGEPEGYKTWAKSLSEEDRNSLESSVK